MAEIPPTESHTSEKKLSFTMMFMSLTRVVIYTILQLVEGVYTTQLDELVLAEPVSVTDSCLEACM